MHSTSFTGAVNMAFPRKMRVLFLSPRACWPPDTGAKLREYHLARQVAARAELTILAFSERAGTADLPFCHEYIAVPPPERYTVGKLIRGVIGTEPVSVLNYSTPPMRQALDELLRCSQFDLVQIEGIPMAGYAELISKRSNPPAVVYNWHNIESELMHRYSARASAWPPQYYSRLTAKRLEVLEKRILREGNAHLVCSEREREKLLGIAPNAFVAVVQNGVDTAGFCDGEAGPKPERTRLLFAGSMNYHANIEAAVDFSRNIWPAIRQEFPKLRLTLAGSHPAQSVRDLVSIPGVEVTGTIPDMRPWYAEAAIAIVPLLAGGGTRLKILEAMAAGVPVISTQLGAEGLEVTAGEDILIARTPLEWQTAVRKLLIDCGTGKRIAAKGRDLVRTRYDWSVSGRALLDVYERLVAGRSAG
jgi:sugar transferase (PEP-CTERM/EpsH1 system associated)